MKRSTVILLLLAAALGVACTKASLKTTYDKQTSYIEGFITAQMKSDSKATLTRNGDVCRLTLHDTLSRPDSLKPGGRVVLNYACYTLTSSSVNRSNLVSTNSKTVASSAGWKLTDTTRFKLDTLVLGKDLVKGLQIGLEGVQQDDEAYILFTGEYGFGARERGTIPARSALIYQVWIKSIDNN